MWRWLLDELIGRPQRERSLRRLREKDQPVLGLTRGTWRQVRAGRLTIDGDDPQRQYLRRLAGV